MAFTDYLMYKCLGLSDDIMCSFHLFFWLNSVFVQYQTRRKRRISIRHGKAAIPISESETSIDGTLHYISLLRPEIQSLMETDKPS